MRRFKNILVLYDRRVGDEAAWPVPWPLAKSNGAQLTVAEAITKLPSDVLALIGPRPMSEAEHRRLSSRSGRLISSAWSLRSATMGCRSIPRFCSGARSLEVIRAVLRESFDLGRQTADIWKGLHQIAFGSTSMHLMRKCPCPVWVMQPNAGRRFRRILAAVDPDLGDGPPGALDLKIMQLASSLARMEACHLDIVHAWDFSGADLDTAARRSPRRSWANWSNVTDPHTRRPSPGFWIRSICRAWISSFICRREKRPE